MEGPCQASKYSKWTIINVRLWVALPVEMGIWGHCTNQFKILAAIASPGTDWNSKLVIVITCWIIQLPSIFLGVFFFRDLRPAVLRQCLSFCLQHGPSIHTSDLRPSTEIEDTAVRTIPTPHISSWKCSQTRGALAPPRCLSALVQFICRSLMPFE